MACTCTLPSDRVIVRWPVPSSCLAIVSVRIPRSSVVVPDSGSVSPSAASLTVPFALEAMASVLAAGALNAAGCVESAFEEEGTLPLAPLPS